MESSDNGFILLHKKIRENWIWEKPDYLKAWLDLLMMVNYKDKKIELNGRLFTIHRGSVITSIRKLSLRWHWDWRKTKRFLEMLEKDGMIAKNAEGNAELISVRNFNDYQRFSKGACRTNGRTTATTSATTSATTTDRTTARQHKEGIKKEERKNKEETVPSEQKTEPDEPREEDGWF